MARPERPVDPQDGPVPAFAAELRGLRRRAGDPKYLTMAASSGRSQTALSEAAGGRRFPTWETTQAYVRACGDDPEPWRARWEDVASQVQGVRAGEAGSSDQVITEDDAATPVEPARPAGQVTQVEPLGPRWGRRRRWAILGVVAAGVVVLAGPGRSAFSGNSSATGGSGQTTTSSPSAPSPSPSPSPSAILTAAIASPAADSVLQRCVDMTGTAHVPVGWALWLAIQVPDADDHPERYYLVGRLMPDGAGAWTLPGISVGSEPDVDRPYWLRIVSSDVSVTGPLDPADFTDVAMASLPRGFDPTPLASVSVRRATKNLPGQTCP